MISKTSYDVASLLRRVRLNNTNQSLEDLRSSAAEYALKQCRDFPEQWDSLKTIATSKQTAISCPRRAGKSDSIMRLIFARMVSRDSYVVRILTQYLKEPSENFLRCGHQESFEDLVRATGLWPYYKGRSSAGSLVYCRFSWGSELHVHHVADSHGIAACRGKEADFYWIDEAQSITLLPDVFKIVIRPTTAVRGQVVLSGTPSIDMDSYFYSVLKGDPEWKAVQYFSWDNPYFGKTAEERWSNVFGMIKRGHLQYGLSDQDLDRIKGLTREERKSISLDSEEPELRKWVQTLDPSMLREMLGRWVQGGAEFVYRWHEAPDLYWGRRHDCMYPTKSDLLPLASTLDGRVEQLPAQMYFGRKLKHSWKAVLGVDPGTEQGPSGSAFVLLVWASTYPKAIVLWSEVCQNMHLGEVLEHAVDLGSAIQKKGITLQCVVGDFASTGVSSRQWSTGFANRLPSNCPLKMPQKAHKQEQIAIVNIDLMAGRLQVAAGDPLDLEGRNLRYKPWDSEKNKKQEIHKWRRAVLPNKEAKILGDHSLDALRYIMPECYHLWQEEPVSAVALSTSELAQQRLERQAGLI